MVDFKKKFQDKTKNKWEQRDNFVAHPGKYTLLEMGEEDDDDVDDDETDSIPKKVTKYTGCLQNAAITASMWVAEMEQELMLWCGQPMGNILLTQHEVWGGTSCDLVSYL